MYVRWVSKNLMNVSFAEEARVQTQHQGMSACTDRSRDCNLTMCNDILAKQLCALTCGICGKPPQPDIWTRSCLSRHDEATTHQDLIKYWLTQQDSYTTQTQLTQQNLIKHRQR